MKLHLLTVGKLSAAFLAEGAAEYATRIKRYLPLVCVELKEEKGGGKKADSRYLSQREGERLLARIPAGAFVVALDERGEGLSSPALARLLDRHMVSGTADLVWIIGGAYGLSDAVRQRADQILSLSKMTLTHQMARLMLLEQIYRGLTIVRNEPYHNG